MYLVERLEKEKQQLNLKIRKLQKNNYRHAQTIVQKNIEIVELKADREKNMYTCQSNSRLTLIRRQLTS